ncbi:hypothetical protein [Halomicrobium urmianum]|uniref:hypothetical protein n=1 Tax=Halomicrobium urmianum TaxID=1586233 RepID=UPI001CD96F67|nr:hypothetical protein [Halomicrobium urmianum]
MVTWRLFGRSSVQRENPNVTVPTSTFEETTLEPGHDVFWAVDEKLELAALLEKHPFAASDLDRSRYQALGSFGLRGANSRMVRIHEDLREDDTDSDGGASGDSPQQFHPGQRRLFIAPASEVPQSSLVCIAAERELRERLTDGDSWAQSEENYSAVFEAGLGDTLTISRSAAGRDDRKGAVDDRALFETTDELHDICSDVDSEIREVIRRIPSDDAFEMVERQYSSLITGTLLDHDVESETFFEGLYDEGGTTVDDVGPVDLRIDIDREMSEIAFVTDRGTLRVEEPELLWDCHCAKPVGNFEPHQQPATAAEIECPIHDHDLGEHVTDLFRSGLTMIRYEDVDVLWQRSRNLWPPSVDAIRMVEALRSDGVFDSDVESVADIGTGTGFLGITLSEHCPILREAYLTDWLLTPVSTAKLNWARNVNRQPSSVPDLKLRLGMGVHFAHHRDLIERSEPLDVCVCNPPYLPDLEDFEDVKINHTVGGTDLLEAVIERGPEIAEDVYVNFSDIAFDAAKRAAERSGAELELVDETWTVPFRVLPALRVDDYTEQLLDHGLREQETGRYRYWHDIGTYRVKV